MDAAMSMLARAIAIEPRFSNAHRLYAELLLQSGDVAGALRELEASMTPVTGITTNFAIDAPPVRVLQLGAAAPGGMTNTDAILHAAACEVTTVLVEYCDGDNLPPHDIIVNAIADPDAQSVALDIAQWLVQKSHARVINHPARVRATGRVENARRLAAIDGVGAPRAASWKPASASLKAALAAHAMSLPAIARAKGLHNGQHMVLLRSLEDEALARDIPGEELILSEFADARGRDGRYRKYRAMFVGDVVLPAHLAISNNWKVHYFSAQMGDAERIEEAAYLDNMEGVLGERAVKQLHAIRATLGLEYAGIDFGLDGNGNVIPFEANAAMTIFVPPPGPHTDYRREAALRIFDAAREVMLG